MQMSDMTFFLGVLPLSVACLFRVETTGLSVCYLNSGLGHALSLFALVLFFFLSGS